MNEVSIIGLDLAKKAFQAHGAWTDGSVVFRRKLSGAQSLKFPGEQPTCVVAMEACASAHHWGRAIGALGHEIRLIPLAYVKPFVKRQKNDMPDAEAIAEAASRPIMRFVAVKSEARQPWSRPLPGRRLQGNLPRGHEEFGRCFKVLGQPVHHGAKMEGRHADPVGQRGPVNVDAGTGSATAGIKGGGPHTCSPAHERWPLRSAARPRSARAASGLA